MTERPTSQLCEACGRGLPDGYDRCPSEGQPWHAERARGLVCGVLGHKPDPLNGAVQMRITMLHPHDIPNTESVRRGVLCLRCDAVLPDQESR